MTRVLLALLLIGCASAGHRAGLQPARLERLYFGRNIGDTAVVSDSAWQAFVRETVTPAFPDGVTMWKANGQWRAADGTLVREPSYVLEVLERAGADEEARIEHVIAEYKRRFAQQSVLRTMTRVQASF